jgi:dGTP triphosphohydrolase
MSAYDSIEDLQKSLHLLSTEQLQELAEKIEDILNEHKEALAPKEETAESIPLEELEFANDMESFAAMADDLDRRGCFEAADEIDELLQKTAAKKKKPGRSFSQWVRQLKKMQASQKVIDKFRKAYKGALEHAKKRKNHNADRAEEYAMRTAVDGLPKKYLKEPTKFHGSKKRGPLQKSDDVKSRKEELLELFKEFGEDPYNDEKSVWEEKLESEEKEPTSLWEPEEQEIDDLAFWGE